MDDPADDINTALATGVGITIEQFEVPAGAAFTRVSLFDDATDGDDDLDLYVFTGDGQTFLGGSGSGTSAEQVNLPGLSAGTYLAVVRGWETDGPDANYTLFDWSVLGDPSADDGTLEIVSAPTEAVLGETGVIEYAWAGLETGVRYLGAVSHSDAGGVFDLTLVSIDTN